MRSCCCKNNCFPQKSVLDLPLAKGLPYTPKQYVGTSLHGQICLIQCMARLSDSPLLCWAGKRILLFNGPVMCSRFGQALGQVLIHPTGTRRWEYPDCQEDESNSGKAKAVAQWGRRLKWGLGGQRCQSWFTTAAGWGTPSPTIPNVLHSKGKMPLWFHSVYEEIKHGFFHFCQPLSVITLQPCHLLGCTTTLFPFACVMTWFKLRVSQC